MLNPHGLGAVGHEDELPPVEGDVPGQASAAALSSVYAKLHLPAWPTPSKSGTVLGKRSSSDGVNWSQRHASHNSATSTRQAGGDISVDARGGAGAVIIAF